MAQIIEALVGHPAGKGTVADDGDDVAVRVIAAPNRGGQAVGVAKRRRRVAVLDPVVHGLGSRRVAREPFGLAQRGEHFTPAGNELVHVGLVARVPDDVVPRRTEYPVQRQRQFDDTRGCSRGGRCSRMTPRAR